MSTPSSRGAEEEQGCGGEDEASVPLKSTSILITLPACAAYVILRYVLFSRVVQESFRQMSIHVLEIPEKKNLAASGRARS